MKLNLRIWRQASKESEGRFETYEADGLTPNMSFLEMLDVVNDRLTKEGQEPIAFEHDCREGICGSCAMAINGEPHGPNQGATTCQVYLRSFQDGETLTVEPWRARAFPVIKDWLAACHARPAFQAMWAQRDAEPMLEIAERSIGLREVAQG